MQIFYSYISIELFFISLTMVTHKHNKLDNFHGFMAETKQN